METMTLKRLNANIRITEVDETAHHIAGFFSKYGLESFTPVKNIVDNLLSKADALSVAIKSTAFQSRRDDADTGRDSDVQGLFKLAEGYLYSPNAKRAAAAEKVWAVLDKYGIKITRENYSSESSLINSMLAELRAGELKDVLTELPDIPEQIDKLAESERAFAQADTEYIEATKKDPTVVNTVELKKDILNIINRQLLVWLEAYLISEPDKIADFAAAVDKLISEQNAKIKSRSTVSRKKSETPETPETPSEE